MMCENCREIGKLIEFNTFSYWYCTKCELEIPLVDYPKVNFALNNSSDWKWDAVEFQREVDRVRKGHKK